MTTETSETQAAKPGKKPVYGKKRNGVKVAVWPNEGKNGTWYSLTHCHYYKDGNDWKETNSYPEDCLLTLAKMIDAADTWIGEQDRQRGEKAA
jgi:hypothetical protein